MSNHSNPPLTIGMATFDDFDGVYFTITSLLIHHRQAMESCEIIVVDNNPDSPHGKQLRKWISSHVPRGIYYPFTDATGTAQARNVIFEQAKGNAVLCLDCHVLLPYGVADRLIKYYADHSECLDLLTGPLIFDSGAVAATHQEPEWRNGAWGVWSIDDRGLDCDNEPFEIWQQGMGLFSCLRRSWVGFHPQFRGFGGCESYIMEKFRQHGGRVLCCPWLQWTHRFWRPSGAPYRVSREDTFRNYALGFAALGIDPKPLIDHYRTLHPSRSGFVATDSQRSERNQTIAVAGTLLSDSHAFNVQHSERNQSIAVAGTEKLGAVRMRGGPLARHYDCAIDTFLPRNGSETTIAARDVIFAIKGGFCSSIRKHCDRLIYDPLDAFCNSRNDLSAREYWRSKFDEYHFDDILATSPACYTVMRDALPESVQVHLVPHHSDPRVNLSWRDKEGPIVYAGLNQYIRSGVGVIRRACDIIGKPFLESNEPEVLRGASLALALRLAPFDNELNQFCKPQVKIANAIAAGIPVVATSCPATTSLYPSITKVDKDFTERELATAMLAALKKKRCEERPYFVNDYLSAVDRILGKQVKVVYTAIFGGRDELQEPEERLPGVQYICFTDNPRFKSNVWSIRYCPPSTDPMMQAKKFKVLAHEFLDCDLSLWIDGKVKLRSLNGAFEWLEADIAFRHHPTRNCIYEEAEHCKLMHKGNPAKIDSSISRYASQGHPRNYGLWYAGMVLRRHTDATQELNEHWWREIESGTSRDQLSLPVVIRSSRAMIRTMPNNLPKAAIGYHIPYSDAPSRSLI